TDQPGLTEWSSLDRVLGISLEARGRIGGRACRSRDAASHAVPRGDAVPDRSGNRWTWHAALPPALARNAKPPAQGSKTTLGQSTMMEVDGRWGNGRRE